jgi:hypothetical protein
VGEDGESPKVPYTPMIILLRKKRNDMLALPCYKKERIEERKEKKSIIKNE